MEYNLICNYIENNLVNTKVTSIHNKNLSNQECVNSVRVTRSKYNNEQIPVYVYINIKTMTLRWGTYQNTPSGYFVGNDGLPLGFIDSTMNEFSKPIYELEYNNDRILCYNESLTINGKYYKKVSLVPLGYS